MDGHTESYKFYEFNQEVSRYIISSCLKSLDSGNRRFGTAVDQEIKACFTKVMKAMEIVAEP